jgi:hypothetical protein
VEGDIRVVEVIPVEVIREAEEDTPEGVADIRVVGGRADSGRGDSLLKKTDLHRQMTLSS